MFVKYNEKGEIIASSNIQLDETYEEKELTETEIQEQINSQKIAEIKQKYQDIIFAKYSLTDQLNMSNEAMYITSMVAFEKRDFTADEIVRLNEIKRAKIWIDEQRKLCGDEILNIE